MTPTQQGITQRTCETPLQGWQASTWYIAEVAVTAHNVFHQSLIFNGSEADGTGARVIHPSYEDGPVAVSSCFAIRKVHLLNLAGALTIEEPHTLILTPRTYYLGEVVDMGGVRPALAFSGFLNGPLKLPGNYSMVMSIETNGQLTCSAYRDTAFRVLRPLFTEDELNTMPESVANRFAMPPTT